MIKCPGRFISKFFSVKFEEAIETKEVYVEEHLLFVIWVYYDPFLSNGIINACD